MLIPESYEAQLVELMKSRDIAEAIFVACYVDNVGNIQDSVAVINARFRMNEATSKIHALDSEMSAQARMTRYEGNAA